MTHILTIIVDDDDRADRGDLPFTARVDGVGDAGIGATPAAAIADWFVSNQLCQVCHASDDPSDCIRHRLCCDNCHDTNEEA